MKLQIPTGLTALLASLGQALSVCHLPEQHLRLSAGFRARLVPVHADLRRLSAQLAELEHRYAQALKQRRQQQDLLRRLVRDAWIMLRRRDLREGQTGQLQVLYRVPALAPQHASATLWLEHGRNLLVGEALACEAGHGAMACPSAQELHDALNLASVAEAQLTEATLLLKDLAAELRPQQRLATHLLRCLAARLRESQFACPPAQTRELLRSFGFRFKATPSDDAEARAELALAAQPDPVVAQAPSLPESAAERGPDPDRRTEPGPELAPGAEAARTGASWSQSLRGFLHGLAKGPDPQAVRPGRVQPAFPRAVP